MSLRTANLLTLGGFCTIYFGHMGILMAIIVQVASDARKPAVLILGPLALAGLAVIAVGKLTKVGRRQRWQRFPIRGIPGIPVVPKKLAASISSPSALTKRPMGIRQESITDSEADRA